MSKLIKKIVICLLTSIFFNVLILGNSTFAITTTEAMKGAQTQITTWKKKECSPGNYPVAIKLYETLEFEGDPPCQSNECEIKDCYQHTLTNDPSEDVGKFTLSATTDNTAKCSNPNISGTLYYCRELQMLLSQSGTIVIFFYINTIYRWAATIVGLISVMVMIFSGIQISTSGGDTEVLSSAKGRIVKSLSGLAVLFLSGLILYTVNPTFFTL